MLAVYTTPTPLSRQVNVTLPQETRDNGTLYAVVYVHKAGVSPLDDNREVHFATQLTTYITPTHAEGQRNVLKVTYNSTPVIGLSYRHFSMVD